MVETINIGGLTLRFLHGKEETGGALDAFEMTLLPNAHMPVPHYHDNWDEVAYGVAGATIFRVAGRDVVLTPGESVFIKRGTVHGFRNDTQESASCLCFLAPGVLGPAYFREVAALVSGGPPDLDLMKETMLRYGLVPVPAA